MNNELEKVVQKLKDVYDIQQLMSKYAYYHIAGMHDEILNELFAKDSEGVHATVPMFGTWEGSEGMQRYTDFHKYVEGDRIGLLMVHPITTPLIEVAEDGKTAKGMFLSPGLETAPFGGNLQAAWAYCKYAMDFIKVDGQWKIWHSRVCGMMKTMFDRSWVDSVEEDFDHDVPEHLAPTTKASFSTEYKPNKVYDNYPEMPKPYKTFSEDISY